MTRSNLVPHVDTGAAAVATLDALAPYVDRRSTSFSSSSTWLGAAARHLPGRPVVVTVRADGDPVAVAALSVVDRRGAHRVQLLGGDLNDYGQFFHDDEIAAGELAAAIASWLGEQRRWSLRCGQLLPGDPVLAALAARLPGAVVAEGPPIPQIRGLGTDYRVSRNRRHQAKNAVNRITADGLTWERVVVEDEQALDRWLPAVVELRRARDHASGRRSHLDDEAVLSFYESVVRAFVTQGRAAIHLLAVEGEVAGFSLAVLDGDTHRLLDGRVAEHLQRYRGGMVSNLMAVSRAAETPGVSTFDWLRGRTEAKYGNHEARRVELRAASHRLVGAVEEWEGAARRRIKHVLPAAAVRQLITR